ncbi:MAG: thymidine phosphorylase, partial [Methylobacterium ajmalii]
CGRTRPQDPIDHGVGLTDLAALGDEVGPERPLAIVHARSEAEADRAEAAVVAAYRIGGDAPPAREVILERVG